MTTYYLLIMIRYSGLRVRTECNHLQKCYHSYESQIRDRSPEMNMSCVRFSERKTSVWTECFCTSSVDILNCFYYHARVIRLTNVPNLTIPLDGKRRKSSHSAPWIVFDRYQSLSDQILGLKTKIIDLYLKNKLLSTRYNIHIGLND